MNRVSPVRLDAIDVFDAIKVVVSRDALLELGDLKFKKKRKKKKKDASAQVAAPVALISPIAQTTDNQSVEPSLVAGLEQVRKVV